MFELKRWDPTRELSALQREMDDLFRRVFGNLGSISPANLFRREGLTKGEWYPVVDCYMQDNKFIVHADLPGVDTRNVDVSIAGNILTIKGERKAELEEKKEGYLVHEACYGSFERMLTIPEGVDTSKATASFKNGVLELTMPCKAEALPKKVRIEIGEGKETKKAA